MRSSHVSSRAAPATEDQAGTFILLAVFAVLAAALLCQMAIRAAALLI